MNHPLISITGKNYKNLILPAIKLGDLNVFIGPNGSGKSNFVALLRFLQQCMIDSAFETERGLTSFEDAVYALGAGKILDGTL